MIFKAYALFDTKVGSYSQPWFFLTDGEAVRRVTEIGLDKDTIIGRYPSDFVLFRVGEYDDNVGLVLSTPHENLGNVVSLLIAYRKEYLMAARAEGIAEVANENGGKNV